MTEHARKLELNENHRRAVSVLIRGTERACDGVLDWLDRPSNQTIEVRDDLSADDQAQMRELAANLREEIRRFIAGISIDKGRASRRRSIAALLSSALIDLEEVHDSALRGYGTLTPEAKAALNEALVRMMGILQQMLQVAERG